MTSSSVTGCRFVQYLTTLYLCHCGRDEGVLKFIVPHHYSSALPKGVGGNIKYVLGGLLRYLATEAASMAGNPLPVPYGLIPLKLNHQYTLVYICWADISPIFGQVILCNSLSSASKTSMGHVAVLADDFMSYNVHVQLHHWWQHITP